MVQDTSSTPPAMPADNTPIDRLYTTLAERLPDDRLTREGGSCWAYGMDNSRQHHPADIVAFPHDHEEVRFMVQAARRFGIAVTTRGRGTGTAGGSVPLFGGLVLCTDHMNRILEFRPEDRLMIVQAGVINADVQKAAAEAGLFWPPDPTSQALCTVGGNLGCNAAGPHAVKYGTTRDNVLGLKAVAGTGDTVLAGTQTTKGVVGYDLTRLLIGSEGTLAVITEATLKLTPLPDARRLLRAFYRDMHTAAEAVSRLMNQPSTPAAIEFIDGNALDLIRSNANLDIPDEARALLMIEVDGQNDDRSDNGCFDRQVENIMGYLRGEGLLSLNLARTPAEMAALWAARKALSPTLRHIAPKKINEDVVVPVSRIPALIRRIDEISARHAIHIVNFGHAGNGNIHVNLLIDPDDPVQMRSAEEALGEVFATVLELDGTLSGEHGIGSVKRDYVGLEIAPETLALMHGIKRVFDPDGIMNPGKKLPENGSNSPAS